MAKKRTKANPKRKAAKPKRKAPKHRKPEGRDKLPADPNQFAKWPADRMAIGEDP